MKYCPICAKNYGDHVEICELDGTMLRIAGRKQDPYLGKFIKGRYQVISKLGEGGMGTVYLAEQMSVGRKVAVKLLQGNYASDEEFIGRFRREARLAASLNHRNIVTVYDFDQAEDGSLFIAMEYLAGRKLSDVIVRDGPLEISRATRLGLQIVEGLEAAHRTGVIHRDIKPDNIMVVGEDGLEEIKLMDFGIARLRDSGSTSQITRSGLIMGTPAYMAPEQAEGGEVSEKTDIYALGIVLYEMLSGAVPFKAATPGAVIIKQIKETPLALRKTRREVPVSIERIVMQALEKEPERRQRGVGEVAQQLRKAEQKLTGEANWTSSRPWNIRGRALKKPAEGIPENAEIRPEEARQTVINDEAPRNAQNMRKTWLATRALTRYEVIPPGLRTRTVKWISASLAALALAAVVGIVIHLARGVFETSQNSVAPQLEIVSLAIQSNKKNLIPKERTILNVSGKYSDGTVQAISRGLEWWSSDSFVAGVNSDGQVEARNEGSAEITARYKGHVSPPITVVVKEEKPASPARPALVSLTVLAVKRELKANERITLRAKGQYLDGSETEINSGVEWKSSDERIASVDSKGRVTARNSGDVRLSANYQGLTSPVITLVVKDSKPTPPVSEPSKPAEQIKSPDEDRIKERLRIAGIYYEQGSYKEAIEELKQVSPENKDAQTLRRRVEKAWAAEKNLGR